MQTPFRFNPFEFKFLRWVIYCCLTNSDMIITAWSFIWLSPHWLPLNFNSKQSAADFQRCSQSVLKVKLVMNLFAFLFAFFSAFVWLFCILFFFAFFVINFFPFTNNYWHSLHAIQQNIMKTVSLVQNNNRKHNQGPKDDNRKDPDLPYHPGSRPPAQKGDHPFKVHRKWIPHLYCWVLCLIYSGCW